jgi:hypothetical protein
MPAKGETPCQRRVHIQVFDRPLRRRGLLRLPQPNISKVAAIGAA